MDGKLLYCQMSHFINVVCAQTGDIVSNINFKTCDTSAKDYDELLTFDLSSDNLIITAHKSGLLKLWCERTGVKLKQWKSNHNHAVLKLLFSPCNKHVCSSSADSVRVWDLTKKLCSTILEAHGLCTIITFLPDAFTPWLFLAGDDNVINCWNYIRNIPTISYKGHLSQISSIDFDENLQFMSSVSLDKVLILWDLCSGTKFKVIPLYESLKGVCFLPQSVFPVAQDGTDKLFVVAAGLNGNIYLVNCVESNIQLVNTSLNESNYGGRVNNSSIASLMYCQSAAELAIVRSDHNILFFDIPTFRFLRQLTGYIDEIFDMCFLGERDQFVAVASNTAEIKIYNMLNFTSVVASGHQETVLTISGYKNYLLSAGKDYNILIWLLDPASFIIRCIQKYTGHNSPIHAISVSNNNFDMFGSVSQDGCLKLWKSTSPNSMKNEECHFKLLNSVVAHIKQINCITFSVNNHIIATGSQDRYIKIWNCKNLNLVGTLRGHQKGVSTVRFSPVDQILVSTSNDCTIRIWSVTKLMCLIKIVEEFSLLRLEFLSKGKYFVTTDSIGAIKIWKVKTCECISSLDGHNDRIWSLTVSSDENTFLTGGVESEIICWRNMTEFKCTEKLRKIHIQNIQCQALHNMLQEKQYHNGFFLALTLNKPLISIHILSKLVRTKASFTIFTETNLTNISKIFLQHIKDWNSKSRQCKLSQLTIFSLLAKFINNPLDTLYLLDLVEGTKPYTKRHYKRLSSYIQDLNFLEFIVKCM